MRSNTQPFVVCLIVCTFFGYTKAAVKGHWGYDIDDGPATWAQMWPTCTGDNQSPIDIIPNEARRKPYYQNIHLYNYDQGLKDVKVMNYGYTVKLFSNSSKARISGGCMKTTEYKFLEIHWHWGKKDDRGSEHQIDGDSYPLELHLVHYNKKYDSSEEAAKNSDGLAVLGLLFKVTKKESKKMAPILEAMKHVEQFGSAAKVQEKITLQDLLPRDRTFYYCYEGSLTTPECRESVTWTIFGVPAEISEEQLEVLRSIKRETGLPLYDNFRPIQPLNNRVVYVKGEASLIGVPSSILFFFALLLSRMTS